MRGFGTALSIGLAALAMAIPAVAAPIANPVATFSGLDKITARVTRFDAYVNETVQFGSLQITPRVCYTQPADETQRTSVFVEVDQVSLKGATTRIFSGWMFADSPALNAVDDAVYDFWLVDCKQHSNVPPPQALNPPTSPATAATASTKVPAALAPQQQPTRVENGSIITLLGPGQTAETAPANGSAPQHLRLSCGAPDVRSRARVAPCDRVPLTSLVAGRN